MRRRSPWRSIWEFVKFLWHGTATVLTSMNIPSTSNVVEIYGNLWKSQTGDAEEATEDPRTWSKFEDLCDLVAPSRNSTSWIPMEMKLLAETVLVWDALAMLWDSDFASLEFCPMAWNDMQLRQVRENGGLVRSSTWREDQTVERVSRSCLPRVFACKVAIWKISPDTDLALGPVMRCWLVIHVRKYVEYTTVSVCTYWVLRYLCFLLAGPLQRIEAQLRDCRGTVMTQPESQAFLFLPSQVSSCILSSHWHGRPVMGERFPSNPMPGLRLSGGARPGRMSMRNHGGHCG